MSITTSCLTRVLLALACLGSAATQASPGAHGPNGEHLDGPAAVAAGSGLPRVEAFSEDFELVGRLAPQGLTLYVSRYETSEAVLGATLELEVEGAKAQAQYQAEAGSYLVRDAQVLARLQQAGSHALVFTISAGKDADLLDGSLVVAAHAQGHDEVGSGWRRGLVLAGGTALALLAAVALRHRARR